MKRMILTAAVLVAISGFAAAQSASSKPVSKQVKATVKKSSAVHCTTKHTVLKHEASANAKSDTTIKLPLALPVISDSTAIPTKKEDF